MKVPKAIKKEYKLIILNLEGNKVAYISLDEKELFCLLILCLKSDHLSSLSSQNVQSLAYNNVAACTGWLVLCCMYEVLCPRLAFLHCSPSYTPLLPLLWAYAWGVE